MPDTEALSMVDAVAKIGPALSATSDMPKMVSGVGDPTPETVPEKPEPAPSKEDKPEDGKTPETPEPQETPAPEPGAEQPPAATKQSKGVQKRLDELTANWRQEQRANAELRELLAKALAPKPEPPQSETPKPKRESFDNPDAYETALLEWDRKTQTPQIEARARAKAEEESRTKKFNETREKWNERLTTFRETHEDFDEVALADSVPMTPLMTATVVSLENGPELAYHLGKHPDVAARIANLSLSENPALAVFELGKVAASLAAPKPEVSKAPPPIKPVGSRANASRKGPDEMSMEEYASMRQNQRRQEWRERHGMVNGQTS